ncbi:hypothetical protein FKM82_005857 [Ascaphus truei]
MCHHYLPETQNRKTCGPEEESSSPAAITCVLAASRASALASCLTKLSSLRVWDLQKRLLLPNLLLLRSRGHPSYEEKKKERRSSFPTTGHT